MLTPAIPYIALGIATLIYLVVDLYPNIKSFVAIGRTGSFWLLWLIFSVLNLIAWGALEVAVGTKAKEWVGRPELAALLLVVLASLGTVTMLQSFTLKAANVKVVDIGLLVENFRQAVLASVAQTMAVLRKREEQELAGKLVTKFAGNPDGLRVHYHTAFSFGGTTTAQIAAQLSQLQAEAKAANLPFEQLLAIDIVKVDVELAKSLV